MSAQGGPVGAQHRILLLAAVALVCAAALPARAETGTERQRVLELFFDPPLPNTAKEAKDAQAAPAPVPTLREGQRVDERRPEQPFTVELFGWPVQLGGSWEYSDEQRRNFDLQRARARDRRVREHEVKLEARGFPAPDREVFVQAVGLHERRRTEGSGSTRASSLERGQTWVRFDRVGGSPWSLQAGRVALIDRRAWWWDEDLDALRAVGAGEGWRLESGLARELMRVSSSERSLAPSARGVTRWFGQASWRPAQRHALELFWLLQHDGSSSPAPGRIAIDEEATDPSDLRARWLGLRASGQFRADNGLRLGYWADLAMLRGHEALTAFDEQADGSYLAGATARRRVRGHALDGGALLILPWPLRPSIAAAYARGSGGELGATLDANFRQTGLQENKARLGGVKRLRVYGELLRPELSNLEVRTLALGIRVLGNSSVELVGYRYRQPVPRNTIAGARLSVDPLGGNGDIGREVDLLIAVREWKHLELTLRGSRFLPGAAFADDQRDPAHAIELGAALNF
ncbi:alginate export family protein [uncultured Piscinibacter sp.]|uniref:alginate export family protein n=1 Tax=uncultured Piscinibacter sp. TaxID=1131835 RepID=UPI002620740E|nr:alginate export family protein [uncultured Piscinibacter sp.]